MRTLLAVCIGALVAVPAATLAQTSDAPQTTDAAQNETAPAAGAGTTTQVVAIDDVQPEGIEYVTTESSGSLYASDLIGQAIYGSTDEKTGDINDLLLDDAGNVQAVIIGVGGFIGLGEKDVAVTLESLDITTTEDEFRITIDATEKDLQEAPVYTRADGTTSDRLGAFERAYDRTRVDAEKALDEAGRRAGELYEQGRQAVQELTEGDGSKADDATTSN